MGEASRALSPPPRLNESFRTTHVHPIRAYLRATPLARWIKTRPRLRSAAVRTWLLLTRIRLSLMSVIRAPGITVRAPFLAVLYANTLLPRKPVEQSESREIVMLVISEVFRDPRVEREARALAAAGYRVRILYPDYFSVHHPAEIIDWGPGIEFAPLPGWMADYVHTFPYLFGMHYLWAATRERPFAFHAHDLRTALVGLAAARFAKAHCVCDFHEWYSENVTWDQATERYVAHPPRVHRVYAWAERLVMRRASAVVTVCDSIAGELERMVDGGRKVAVVRNIPSLRREPSAPRTRTLREELGLSGDRFLLLYQGGTGPTRLLEPVIEAVARVPRAVFVVRGPGIESYGKGYDELAARLGIGDRVLCLPPVKSDAVVEAAAGADAGIWTLPNLSRNFYFALPNKIFEYMAAGLPVLGAGFPEARKLIEGLDIGHCFDPYDPDSIASAIRRLADDPTRVAGIRQRMRAALASIDAEDEWSKLVDVYRTLEPGFVPSASADGERSATEGRGAR
jgi:glycosyltransferase involved in cell wall biosynthesis